MTERKKTSAHQRHDMIMKTKWIIHRARFPYGRWKDVHASICS